MSRNLTDEKKEPIVVVLPRKKSIGDSFKIDTSGYPWVMFDPYSGNSRVAELWEELLIELQKLMKGYENE